MAAALLEHLTNGWLSHIKEPVSISGHNCPILLLGIFMKVPRYENSGVVYQQIDPPCSGPCRLSEFHAQRSVCHVPVYQNATFGRFKHSSLCDVSCGGNDVIAL